MIFTQRTHTCGELRRSHVGQKITLNGWVDGKRNLGGLLFIDLRDRYGLTQIAIDLSTVPDSTVPLHSLKKVKSFELYQKEELIECPKLLLFSIRTEWVLSVSGLIQERPNYAINSDMLTGDIELLAEKIEILNFSHTLPFEIKDDVDAFEDLRLKYRYLDLRRNVLQQNLITRHKMYQVVHRYFDELNFIEIETPVLMKSTPEGARDYLVPSRIHHGNFYALPQSPQLYKQLLMVAGFDRYVQIVKCFRDEDLRSDRQPEFTQIDLEMSFIRQEDVFALIEGLMKKLFQSVLDKDLQTPFLQLDYHTAIIKYGSDKPDVRFGMEIISVNDVVQNCGFKIFYDVIKNGGVVAGINVKGQAGQSRSQLDALTEKVKSLGAHGLVWMKAKNNTFESPIAKYFTQEILQGIKESFSAEDGDLILIISDTNAKKAYTILGTLRLELAKQLNLYSSDDHSLCWVIDFPLFQWDDEEKRYVAEHHPFTSPKDEDMPLLVSDPLKVRANCYDLVWNGNEVGSGSIRIHDIDTQSKVFSLLGLTRAEEDEKFGFLINAFRYGAPPHGGMALGFDRMVALFTGNTSIRDVIAFPKTNSALSLMDESPSRVSQKQLDELHLAIKK